MKLQLTFLLCMALVVHGFGQITFQKTYGGTDSDDGHAVKQTSDGGYIIAGTTYSFGVGNGDFYLIKTDSIGDTLWTRTFGGPSFDFIHAIDQTSDGGYILTGHTYSFSMGYNGDTLWTKTYRGANPEEAYSVQQTTDGGYIIVGVTNLFTPDSGDVYLMKTDSSGNVLWTRTYGGTGNDIGYSVQQNADG